MDYERYAIWWVPRPGTGLAQFGAEWTGWCADQGVVSSDPAVAASAGRGRAAPPALVRRGLHASLRAPFRLAHGCSRWALEDALAELAERSQPLLLPRLELAIVDGRVVLALSQRDRAVSALVANVAEAVRLFALPMPCAAPGGSEDGASVDRRNDRASNGAHVGAHVGAHDGAGRSTDREADRDADGEDDDDRARPASSPDRLHLPLTGRLELARAFAVVAELDRRLAPVLARRQSLADLALAGDPGGGRPWRLLQRHPLAGAPARRDARVPSGMDWRGPSLLAPFAGGPATA